MARRKTGEVKLPEPPKKAEPRSENPTIRCTANDKKRFVAAAKACGFEHYTDWMYRVVLQAADTVLGPRGDA